MDKSGKNEGRCKSEKKRPPCQREDEYLRKNSTKISNLSLIDKQTTKLALIPHSHQKVRATFCKSHPICDSRVFRISSYFNQLKIKVILEYGRSFSFIRHFVEFLGGRETTVVFEEIQSVSTSYILKAPSVSQNCFSEFKLLLHELNTIEKNQHFHFWK